MDPLLNDVASRASRYLDEVAQRPVFPSAAALRGLQGFAVELQDEPIAAAKVLAELDALGSPATVASTGGRYFGFVTGGAMPATLAANMLAGAWDQNAWLELGSPVNAHLEKVCRGWLVSLLGLPEQMEVGFATGATMANFTGLAAARHAVLHAHGWDVEAQGLFGAPPITVIVGKEVHVSVLKALGMLGLGRQRVVSVPVDGQGRMIATQLPPSEGPTIVCAQAGNVNTGAFDPLGEIAARAVEVWAALRALGQRGLAELIERNCEHATRFASELGKAGHQILNDVVLNQVLVSFGAPDVTRRAIAAIQQDGTCWCGGTSWQGNIAMRISVSSWATTDTDVAQSIDAILRCAREVQRDGNRT